jgi:Flp pilus assembly protein TadD
MTADDLDAAVLLRAEGRLKESSAALVRHLAAAPDDGHALRLLAAVQLQSGRRLAARDSARRATAVDPGSATAWTILAEASHRLGEADDARAGIAEALRLAPHEWRVHASAAYLGMAEPFPTDVTREHASECVRLAPEEPGAHLVVADMAVRDRRSSAARAAFRTALALEPENVDARRGLDGLALDTGRAEIASAGALAQLADAPASTAALVHLRSLVHQVVTRLGALPALAPWATALLVAAVGAGASEAGSGPLVLLLLLVPLVATLAGAAWWLRLVTRFAAGVGLTPRSLLGRLRTVSPAHVAWLALQAGVLVLLVVGCSVLLVVGGSSLLVEGSAAGDPFVPGPALVLAGVCGASAFALSVLSWLGGPVLGALVSSPSRRGRRRPR